MWWDDERIGWYREAAAASRFHRLLADEIGKHAGKDESILELGCGLGYVAELLHSDGFRISATDSDPAAIKEAIRRTGYGIYSLLDASSPLPHADTILMIFFGHLSDNGHLRRYLSSAGKLIYIISEHRGQSGSLRHRPGEPDATMRFLSSQKGIRWRRIPFEADFSQPLSSIEDAWAYTRRMYGNEKAGKYMEFIRRTDGGYLLPNHKHSSIFIITKEEECEEDTHALDDHGSAAPSRS